MYKEVISPVLDRLDSEKGHVAARELLHLAEISPVTLKILERLFAYKGQRFEDERLRVLVGGIEFGSPTIIGPGWDKVGKTLKAWYALGASSVEVGAVLAFDQKGNDQPRQWYEEGRAFNRLGFNSPGMHKVVANTERYRGAGIPVGFNLGINKEIIPREAPTMYAIVAKVLAKASQATDSKPGFKVYFTINVSSPNTPGLRSLQDKRPLTDIVQAVNSELAELGIVMPIFIKISPDLTLEAVDDVIDVAITNKIAGIVATNTTVNPDIKAHFGEKWRNEPGGLSGDDPEFRRLATERVAHIFQQAGNRLEIIGVGGINSWQTALEKILAGASAIQVVTGIRQVGTTLPGRINRGLVGHMEEQGIKNINELVGIEASHYTQKP